MMTGPVNASATVIAGYERPALPLATAVPSPSPPLEGYTFEGYRNPDGAAGTRNILGIATTVQCVAPTVDYAVGRIRATRWLRPGYGL